MIYFRRTLSGPLVIWLAALFLLFRYSHNNASVYDGGEFLFWAVFPWLLLLNLVALENARFIPVAGLITPLMVLVKYSAGLSVAGLGAMSCFFYAIGKLRLADAVLLNFSLPLFIPLVARVGLGERFPPRLWRALGLGFVGLILILKPTPGLFDPAALVGLAAGMLGAVAQVTIRGLTSSEPTTRIVFYFAALSTLLAALPAAAVWNAPPP